MLHQGAAGAPAGLAKVAKAAALEAMFLANLASLHRGGNASQAAVDEQRVDNTLISQAVSGYLHNSEFAGESLTDALQHE